jgi:hypothetical protein
MRIYLTKIQFDIVSEMINILAKDIQKERNSDRSYRYDASNFVRSKIIVEVNNGIPGQVSINNVILGNCSLSRYNNTDICYTLDERFETYCENYIKFDLTLDKVNDKNMAYIEDMCGCRLASFTENIFIES